MADPDEDREARGLYALYAAAEAFQRGGDQEGEARSRRDLLGRLQALRDAGWIEQMAPAAMVDSLSGDPRRTAQAQFGYALALGSLDRAADSLPFLSRAAMLFASAGDRSGQLRAQRAQLDLLVKLERWDELVEACGWIIAATEGQDEQLFRTARLDVLWHRTHHLWLRGQFQAVLSDATEAVDLAAHAGERGIEAELRLKLAHALEQLERYHAAAEAYEEALTTARQSDRRYLASDELQAMVRVRRARCLEHTWRRIPDAPAQRERAVAAADEYEQAGTLFDACQLTGDAGDAYLAAVTVIVDYQFLLDEPELRARGLAIAERAAERLQVAGNWWGKGVVESDASILLWKNAGGSPDDRWSAAMASRAARSFLRAGRFAEASFAYLDSTLQLTTRLHRPEGWLRPAWRMVRSYERSRSRLLLPHDRDRHHRRVVEGLSIMLRRLLQATATRLDDPWWSGLVFGFEQLVKGRSFQALVTDPWVA